MKRGNPKKKAAQQKEFIKRELSQINFQAQHWWAEKLQTSSSGQIGERQLTIDEEKAAMIYEAMRRRPEVQQAWLEGKFGIGANGWQSFVGLVVKHLRQSWPELNKITRDTLLEAMQSWFFVPPLGYSTFPDKSSGREKQRESSFKLLNVPDTDEPEELRHFAKQARRFRDAGFVIVAVDNKTKQSIRYALQGLEQLPRSFRKADVEEIRTAHLPDDLPQSEIDALEKKRQSWTLTIHDISEAWSRHDQRRHETELRQKLASGKALQEINRESEARQVTQAETGDGWKPLVSSKTEISDKRKRKGQLIESKTFNFVMICRELDQLDAGKVPQSDFVQRIRLC